MQKPVQKLEWLIWTGLILVIIGVIAAFFLSRHKPVPVSAQKPAELPIIKAVPDFSLTNQFEAPVSLSDLRGNVWLADIIFTRCPGPCARMTRQFSDIQSATANIKNLKFVSLTADPEFDTPEVLRSYGQRFGANTNNWWFITGPKPALYTLATDGLLLALAEKTPAERESAEDLFIHSTIFVLVDQNANIRAIYQSDDEGSAKRIIADINKLIEGQ